MEVKKILDFDPESMDNLLQDAIDGALSADLVPWAGATVDRLVSQTKMLMGTVVEYKELMMMYACAMKQVRAKFDVLNTAFQIRYQRNPISSISARLKKTASITDKLSRNGLPFSLESIESYINDVAGIRVICSYIDDIYTIADALLLQDDVTLVTKKDYISNPKPNGYRSLHLVIKVPVYFADGKKEMKVEVQIRTIAMDFWASLEHQLKYKQDIPNQRDIVTQLKECADIINTTDEKMRTLRHQIEKAADIKTEDDILFEKLSKLDIAID